jgi:hypothetical protein
VRKFLERAFWSRAINGVRVNLKGLPNGSAAHVLEVDLGPALPIRALYEWRVNHPKRRSFQNETRASQLWVTQNCFFVSAGAGITRRNRTKARRHSAFMHFTGSTADTLLAGR